MIRKNIVFYIVFAFILIFSLCLFSKSVEKNVFESRKSDFGLYQEVGVKAKYATDDVGVPQGLWSINGVNKSTQDILNDLKVGSTWGAVENVSEKEYNRIQSLVQYMGVSEHSFLSSKCYYSEAANRVLKETKHHAPYYHQGLFGKELWGDVISGTYIANPDSGSTFNKNGCHIYTLAYALSVIQERQINPPEALVLGWYCGFWNNGMGPTENVENWNKYLGVNVCTVSDDKENGKKEVDTILDNNGVAIIYVGKPFSFGNYHWICITDRVNDNGVDKYRIWTSTSINQMYQLYTFDYLYSRRTMEDWIRLGVMP